MYSIVANEIVDGGRPYIDAVDRNPPLLLWTYAGCLKQRESSTGRHST
jgi:hypothetical protein